MIFIARFCVCALSHVRQRIVSDFAIACTTALQAPLSRHFPGNFPGNNTGVGFHLLLQGIFVTKELNPCLLHLLHWQVNSLSLATWEALFYDCCVPNTLRTF